MVEVYSWATPNGPRVHIMLEECALPYKVVPVDIGSGDPFKSDHLVGRATSPAANTPLPTLPSFRGCAAGRTKASIGLSIPTQRVCLVPSSTSAIETSPACLTRCIESSRNRLPVAQLDRAAAF